MGELSGKVAIVTGGGQGIGRQIALAFAQAGASVAVTGRTKETLAETVSVVAATGARVESLVADVANEEDCAAMVAKARDSFGRLDVLVNNAGIAGVTKKTTAMSLVQWQEVIDIDLTGAWLAARAALAVFEQQRSGVVLNISSAAGRHGYPFRSPYAAAKWALIGLTQTWAGEFGPQGIRVNCICPGAIEGERIDRVIRARADTLGLPYEEVKAGFVSDSPMQRMATELEVAKTAVFLSSDLASGITGQTVNVNCGARMD